MLKFFRKIRQKLLQQNRITQYLTYAIGEILLVAIENYSPFRDLIWVEQTISQATPVPLGTGYIKNLSALQIIWRT